MIGNYTDDFTLLAYKDAMLLSWTQNFCLNVSFVFKGDDDILLLPWNLENQIEPLNSSEVAIYGQVMGGVGGNLPSRGDGSGKYLDRKWPAFSYPKYCSGAGFVITLGKLLI